ncbi:hypothetical protein D554_2400 [Bordetella holmesii 30539]|nr:DUF1854 domain-containing protein [Bordetella holmesii]AHV92799.1 hypothetical protein D560_2453 [Bordetella holmesii ATCC 51541]AIT27094.1 hypothetical protein D558_2433 [Bordetella holmesii 44057]EWM44028.1 hypothetical protein D556_2433 [Bordetella holmesii 41130]EWM47675.1 hypothetical protein D555_2466 [Bordetella holmesii 35009]EWM51845.1 hypothetical protein D557_1707 [Bordetella holmesii 70147]EXF87145.1 hypothetical protein D554_2400 [Bordetella holmesii 30539]EXX93149.1 hypothet
MDFQLKRNEMGRLVLTFNGQTHDGVMPVRAFPISAPAGGLSLVTPDGREVLWLDSIDCAPVGARALIEEDLAGREFMPEIRRIVSVSTYATPSTWQVETDRGDTQFVLRGEEDIRRLAGQTLLISDSHGIHYLIRDALGLDRHSRKILDRFL